MAISGTEGFVLKDGVAKPADKWSANLKQVVVDRSNFMTAGEPLNAKGQRTGEVTIEGPYEAPLGIDRGQLVLLSLGLSALPFAISVTVRVSDLVITNDKDSGPRWSITGSQYGAASVIGL
jgi:hypothetical protein